MTRYMFTRGFTLGSLLNKLWPQVSSLLPPTCKHPRILLTIPRCVSYSQHDTIAVSDVFVVTLCVWCLVCLVHGTFATSEPRFFCFVV